MSHNNSITSNTVTAGGYFKIIQQMHTPTSNPLQAADTTLHTLAPTSSNTVPVDAAQEMEVQAAASDTTLHTLAPSNTDAVQELQIVTSPEAVTSALVTPAAVTSAVRSHLVLFLQFFPKHLGIFNLKVPAVPIFNYGSGKGLMVRIDTNSASTVNRATALSDPMPAEALYFSLPAMSAVAEQIRVGIVTIDQAVTVLRNMMDEAAKVQGGKEVFERLFLEVMAIQLLQAHPNNKNREDYTVKEIRRYIDAKMSKNFSEYKRNNCNAVETVLMDHIDAKLTALKVKYNLSFYSKAFKLHNSSNPNKETSAKKWY